MFFFPFLCSAIPDLDLGILSMYKNFSYVQESFKFDDVNCR